MSTHQRLGNKLRNHYGRQNLEALILAALSAAGKSLDNLQPADLAAVDEFHVRGRQATVELARAAGIEPGMQVLDVGSGIGGPSRFLAAEFGCRVTGIDLTGEYCRAAKMLAELVGLAHLVNYQQGDALRMPYAAQSFDVVWTQHTAMNIPDKAALYREMARVLKPGGTLAIYDVLAGPVMPVHFPVPWAQAAETSFLVSREKLLCLLTAAGFSITAWEDTTEAALQWFRKAVATAGEAANRPLGLHLLLGDDFPHMVRNQLHNLAEARIILCQVTAAKLPLAKLCPAIPAAACRQC